MITIDYFDRMPKADFEKVLAVNTTGVWLCCREAAKYMVKQNYGSLINTSSGQGRQGFIYTPHYAASKMGVIGITQSLAHELAPWNITLWQRRADGGMGRRYTDETGGETGGCCRTGGLSRL